MAFRAADYQASGFRKRVHQFVWSGRTETDYVCRRCCTIVPDTTKGCGVCIQADAAQEEQKAKARAFFAERKAQRERDRAESDRLKAEARAERKRREA